MNVENTSKSPSSEQSAKVDQILNVLKAHWELNDMNYKLEAEMQGKDAEEIRIEQEKSKNFLRQLFHKEDKKELNKEENDQSVEDLKKKNQELEELLEQNQKAKDRVHEEQKTKELEALNREIAIFKKTSSQTIEQLEMKNKQLEERIKVKEERNKQLEETIKAKDEFMKVVAKTFETTIKLILEKSEATAIENARLKEILKLSEAKIIHESTSNGQEANLTKKEMPLASDVEYKALDIVSNKIEMIEEELYQLEAKIDEKELATERKMNSQKALIDGMNKEISTLRDNMELHRLLLLEQKSKQQDAEAEISYLANLNEEYEKTTAEAKFEKKKLEDELEKKNFEEEKILHKFKKYKQKYQDIKKQINEVEKPSEPSEKSAIEPSDGDSADYGTWEEL